MKLIVLVFSILAASCSFKGGGDQKKSQSLHGLSASDLQKMDSDGDLVSDYDEIQKGRDPFMADIPKAKVNFLQDYSIKVYYEDESSFVLDTVVARDNPDFKYRVGNLFLKEHSLDNAAKLGRFSGVSWGKIKQEDYSWVMFPQIDEEYYFSKAREYRLRQGKKIRSIDINLENSLKLKETATFLSIKDLEVNFYYYSYSKESYVLLHTEKLEGVFQAGVNENFTVNIQNPPVELLEDTYFRHGKFIISEIKDFAIPGLGLRYSELLESVKSKTVPVYRTSPYENTLDYVAVKQAGESFINILKKLYAEKFEVREGELVQVEQFSNNLPDFKYLQELTEEDKNGRWFVMTNELKQHYLKHSFRPGDSVTLSYITGDQLAKRVAEDISSFQESVYSGEAEKVLALGNISNNSQLSLSIYLNALKGSELISTPGHFSFSPPNCRNCTGNNWHVWANFVHNTFSPYERQWEPKSYAEAKEAFSLLINNSELNLEELIEQNIASVALEQNELGPYLHITLQNLHKLNLVESGSENALFLKLRPLNIGFAGEGLEIREVGGSNIDKKYHAGMICLQQAAKRKAPLAVTSWAFDEWKDRVPWGSRGPNGFVPSKGQKRKYWDGVVVDVISKITNHFN